MHIGREMKPAPVCAAISQDSPIAYRLATTQRDLEQAFELVRNEYTRVGLHARDRHGLRITKYHLLPEAKVFVAVALNQFEGGKTAEQVVGTITVIPDGALGLPAEAVAGKEIDKLRQARKRAAEFIALAANDEGTKNRVILKLFRLAYEYSRAIGIHTIYASLTERHIGFYQRFLGLKPLGELAPYEMGNGMPVQVHFLDVSTQHGQVEYRSRALERDPTWQHFWHHELRGVLAKAIVARPWTPRLMSSFLRKSQELQQQLDSRTIAALGIEYGRYGQSLVNPRPTTDAEVPYREFAFG